MACSPRTPCLPLRLAHHGERVQQLGPPLQHHLDRGCHLAHGSQELGLRVAVAGSQEVASSEGAASLGVRNGQEQARLQGGQVRRWKLGRQVAGDRPPCRSLRPHCRMPASRQEGSLGLGCPCLIGVSLRNFLQHAAQALVFDTLQPLAGVRARAVTAAIGALLLSGMRRQCVKGDIGTV